ncbi:MFS monocarboxylate transporter [Fusarium venenatum]|uniref:MFS monocarboxylate transporter n=1 Tax=Fusarium venenatum TaxID=56646 RepID=UPI001D2497A2|nr:MFS monocarboxylate transporter [Fusarium venenatum]
MALRNNKESATDALHASLGDTKYTDNGIYPEGGLAAWLCVFGSFMGLLPSLGLVNSLGSFQAYLETHQLQDYDAGKIGWIFSVYTFLTFFFGIFIGPIFDARGPQVLIFLGSVLILAAMLSIGFCVEYWHFLLVFGFFNGLGTSLVFTPAIGAIGHFFFQRRGIATGIAAGGGAIGGILVPLVLENLLDKVGFAWVTRVIALVWLICLGIACITITSRLPKKPFSRENILPDLRIFRNVSFLLTTLAVFFVEWGIFIPISYIPSYTLAHGVSSKLSYQLLAIMNAGSFFGRILPGYFADFLGRFNVLILTTGLCFLSNVCLWLPAAGNVPILVVYSCAFGFFSGSGISLTPVCIGQLCDTEDYGRYYATAYTVVSLGTLTGIPIAGEILSRCNGEYWGLITFTTCCYAAGLICAISVKVLECGWRSPLAVY